MGHGPVLSSHGPVLSSHGPVLSSHGPVSSKYSYPRDELLGHSSPSGGDNSGSFPSIPRASGGASGPLSPLQQGNNTSGRQQGNIGGGGVSGPLSPVVQGQRGQNSY